MRVVDEAETKAAYRLFDNERVKPDAILGAHYDATRERIASLGDDRILIAHDRATLNDTTHHASRGMGAIGASGLSGFGCIPRLWSRIWVQYNTPTYFDRFWLVVNGVKPTAALAGMNTAALTAHIAKYHELHVTTGCIPRMWRRMLRYC